MTFWITLAMFAMETTGSAYAEPGNDFQVTVLVESDADAATHGWGLASSPHGPWVTNGAGSATARTGAGSKLALDIVLRGGPTGAAWYDGDHFRIEPAVSARLLFATASGTVVGWSPRGAASPAVLTGDPGSAYTGIAVHRSTLFVADFTGCAVEAYDGAFQPLDLSFAHDVPRGYCPFGVHALDGSLFVTYALSGGGEPVPGTGNGAVREYAPDGSLVAEVASRGRLDAPWGLALAPAGFGRFEGCLLVGNSGDGRIHAFCKDDAGRWRPAGPLREDHHDLVVDGLMGLGFGNGGLAGPEDVLYFAASPRQPTRPTYGRIESIP